MAFHINDKKNSKLGNKNQKSNAQGSKFIAKPGAKAAGPSKKPIKTGGSRGS